MKVRGRSLNKNQRGFTLIEIIIAIAIVGLIGAGVFATIFQVLAGNTQASNQMVAIRQVQNTGYWVSRDTLQADPDGINTTAAGYIVTLSWNSTDTGYNEVRYELAGERLQRLHSRDGVPVASSCIANYIAEIRIDPSSTEPIIYRLVVTAALGGRYPASETRVYEIIPRPSAEGST